MIPGLDRSHLNGKVPLSSLTAKGIQFIWFKVAQYSHGEDVVFNASWEEAKNTPKLMRGGYYFFDPHFDGVAQCKQFLSFNINFSAPGCMGGCVDVEDLVVFGKNGKEDPVLTAQANKWVEQNWELAVQRLKDFLAYYKQETGLDCFIYSYNNYLRETYHATPFPNNPMWISAIEANCPVRYDTGKLPTFWQNTYGWRGTDMDGDYFMGTQDELNTLANIVT